MQFIFNLPVYAFVESAAPDASGATTFKNPMIVTGKGGGDTPISIEIIPLFTSEAKAAEVKNALKAPQTVQLRMAAHEHLIEFLKKASGRATHVAIDPSMPAFTSDRIWPINDFLAQLKTQAGKQRST